MKFTKKILLFALFVMSAGLLTACQQTSSNEAGFFQWFLVNPFIEAIHWIAAVFGDNYGMAIIIITIIIKLILMPLMLKQYKNQQHMKIKMEQLKPEMEEIQKKLRETKTKEEQQKLQQEMFALYRKHGVNPLNMGCLPILIQMPLLLGLYYAIRGSHDIATHSFLWFSLGQPDLLITAIAGIVYYLQFKVSLINLTEEQRKQMKLLGLISPIMIVFISLNAPAALPLYWAVSGLFLIIQSWIGKRLYPQTTGQVESINS
ncbi:MAG TPA: membrane protein insertase YidC [Bacillus sp. (in: firmicutes)]|uniref:membrane protein insertase YidC n=1 Tax=Bacillus litorisediminis TaxID=2922713 RepID=UPI001FAD1D04|nr:membrane protein insertase YidC [Bacillus litorisediminis]HWO78464.1 membrane protein insertase YidC [Bacillus sp. (in: firmicutes)]